MRLPSPLAVLALLLLFGWPANAQYEGTPIARIEFTPADQPLPRDELDRLVSLQTGTPFRQSDLRLAIQRLYSTGRYSDIAADATLVDGRVVLRFITERTYFVGRVSINGASDPPSRSQLAIASKLQLGTPYADNDLPQAVENMAALLRANGFYNATVTPRTQREPMTEQIRVDFTIDPGKRAKFDGVVVSGQPDRSLPAIIRSTRWKGLYGLLGWKPLTEARLSTGIEHLRQYYQKNNHLLATVTLERLAYHEDTNRVTPSLRLDAGPSIFVKATGAKISKGRLQQLIPIFQERSVDHDLLVEGQRNMVDYLQSEGYFDAQVDFQIQPAKNNQQIIEYQLDPDSRHKLVSLEIAGNKYFDTATLRERMYITPASFLRYRHGRYSQKQLERDVETIQELYRSNGFRDVKVTSKAQDNYHGHADEIGVLIQITEGKQWTVSKLEFEGISDADQEYLRTVLRSGQSQPFSEVNVAVDRETVLAYYYNDGYPSATFDWNQSPGPSETEVNLRFVIHPGKRLFVRNVLIDGLVTTNPSLVRSRLDIKPGAALSTGAIADSQRRLYDLGIFAKVETAIQNPDGVEDSKYVIYQFEEARKYSTNVGVGAQLGRIGGGVTSFDAPAGTAGFSPRVSFGISRLNFLGLGHTLSLQSGVSTIQKRAQLVYLAPQFEGRENLHLTLTGLFDDSHDIRTFSARRLEGSIQLADRLSKANTIQYRFTFRRVGVTDLKISPSLIPTLSQADRAGFLSTTFIQDRRDDPTDSHRGVYNTIDFGLALKAVGSQTEFTRLSARNSTYHRIGKDLVLARSTYIGDIQRFGGLAELPLPERFFSGGANSHRGFPDNQAGPRDTKTGFPLGGNALLFNSVELRFPLIGDNLGGVLFHDAGNVYSSFSDISFRYHQRDLQDFNYMVHAVGLGFRLRTPVGPIRFDLAYAPNSPRFFGFKGTLEELLQNKNQPVNQRISTFQFHFSLGQAF